MARKPKSQRSKEDDDPQPPVIKLSKEATGVQSLEAQTRLVKQALEALWNRHPHKQLPPKEYKAVYDMLLAINPRDGLEGMLAVQMVATHEAAVECLVLAAVPKQTSQWRDLHLKHAIKLMGVYLQQLAALDKHRGKGQQKLTVKHVHVNEGGQAIVGNVERGRGSSDIEEHRVKALEKPKEKPMTIDAADVAEREPATEQKPRSHRGH